jgi:hypothetical protein
MSSQTIATKHLGMTMHRVRLSMSEMYKTMPLKLPLSSSPSWNMNRAIMKDMKRAPKLFLAGLFVGACLSKRILTIPQNDTCTTRDCIRAAAHLLENMHPEYHSIDPCEDFGQC